MSDLPDAITVNVKTASKYGQVKPGDVLVVGEDIDEAGARRWIGNGIARPGVLKTHPEPELEKPTSSNTKDEIKAYLDAEGVEYSDDMLKDELLDLVE